MVDVRAKTELEDTIREAFAERARCCGFSFDPDGVDPYVSPRAVRLHPEDIKAFFEELSAAHAAKAVGLNALIWPKDAELHRQEVKAIAGANLGSVIDRYNGANVPVVYSLSTPRGEVEFEEGNHV